MDALKMIPYIVLVLCISGVIAGASAVVLSQFRATTSDSNAQMVIDNATEGVKTVYHVAGMLGKWGVPESAYHAVHVEGTCNLLRASAHRSLARFVHCSSPGMLGFVI